MQPRHLLAPLLLTAALLAPVTATAAEQQFQVDGARSRVEFQVDARLHLVRGTLPVASGELRFDPETGTASGRVIAEAALAATGNGRRDRKMHDDVLLSAAFPTIVFTAEGFEGAAIAEGIVVPRRPLVVMCGATPNPAQSSCPLAPAGGTAGSNSVSNSSAPSSSSYELAPAVAGKGRLESDERATQESVSPVIARWP